MQWSWSKRWKRRGVEVRDGGVEIQMVSETARGLMHFASEGRELTMYFVSE